MLKEHGDWMLLGSADEQKPAAEGTVEAWARSPANPVGGWVRPEEEPALELEQLVVGRIRDLLSKPIDLAAPFPSLSVKDTRLLVAAGRLSMSTLKTSLLEQRGDPLKNDGNIHLECPLLIRRRGSEVRLVLENGEATEPKPIPSLTRAVALSRHWADGIVNGKFSNLDEVARSAGLNRRCARRILQCAALSPTLTEIILEGRQPIELSVDRLTRNLPLLWEEQRL
jgi:site-specific DNA recombinase